MTMAITLFHPTYGNRRRRGMAVIDIPLVGLDSKKSQIKKPPAMIKGLID